VICIERVVYLVLICFERLVGIAWTAFETLVRASKEEEGLISCIAFLE
jgi:hypothetical protein